MKNRILFAILFCVIAVSNAFAEARIFVEYPTLGECTADNVRIRTEPNTNSEIIGKLNEYDKIIVLRKVKSGNNLWYEVENPTGEGEAYVFGKYLLPAYRQEFQRSKGAKFLTDIRLTYGSTPERMLALSSKPKKLTRSNHDTGFPVVIGDWGDYRVFYWDTVDERAGYLKSLEVKSGNKPFGSIHIGDSTEKLLRELGSPANKSKNLWEYEIFLYGYDEEADECVDSIIFRFTIDDEKVSRMYYYNYEDGEDALIMWNTDLSKSLRRNE